MRRVPTSCFTSRRRAEEEILTFVPAKTWQSVVISTPANWRSATTYDVYLEGSSSGTETDGLYTGGTYTAGTLAGSLTLS